MGLRFDINKFTNEFLRILEEEIRNAAESWERDIYANVNSSFYNYIFEGKRAKVENVVRTEVNGIIAYLKANTYVIVSSYGTGSLMLDDNPRVAKIYAKWIMESS